MRGIEFQKNSKKFRKKKYEDWNSLGLKVLDLSVIKLTNEHSV